MEAINDSTKLIAQAIDMLNTVRGSTVTIEDEECLKKSIQLLRMALDKLVGEIK